MTTPAPPMPRPEVNVTTDEGGKTHAVISRDGKSKSFEVDGVSPNEKIKSGIEKVINDPFSAEFLPARGEQR